jgi:hypothetical protein
VYNDMIQKSDVGYFFSPSYTDHQICVFICLSIYLPEPLLSVTDKQNVFL